VLDNRRRFLLKTLRIMNTTTLQLKNSVNRSHLRLAFLLIPLAWFAVSPQARATCQQGCLGNNNTVLGDAALVNNTTGFDNTAVGDEALFLNTTGHDNTASGLFALLANTSGFGNTAIGVETLLKNTTGHNNTAIGVETLPRNTTGHDNTATGAAALLDNKDGNNNTAIGRDALRRNQHGRNNIALGFESGFDSTGNDNINIGNRGVTDEENAIRIGTVGTHAATFMAGISGVTVPSGVAVIIDTDGHLGTVTSSARYKENLQPMDKASEAILALQPVTFHYKKELDPGGIPQFGLVAEQVDKVNPDLVARDEQGKPYTVRYEAVNAMLLNEFLKEHRKVQDLEANAARQQKQIEALAAGLQKVSAQLELGKHAPQVVDNR
jgi:hypothetical protein